MSATERWTYGLDWNLLRTFLVIADERSITRAAARLLLQQPSVSMALKRLEESFGCQLFERGQRPLNLTPQGQVLYTECRGVFGTIANLRPKVSASVRSVTGLVRLKVVTQIVSESLDDAFRRLNRSQPGISFQVEVANSNDIVRAVSQQIVPFGICLLSKPIPTLTCHFLFREKFGIFCGPDHHLTCCDKVGLDDIRAEPWVTFTAESLEPMVGLRLGANLASQVAASSSDLQEVSRFITVGLGIGILPVASAQRDIQAGRLVQLPVLATGELGADLYLLSNPAAESSPADRAFEEEIMRLDMYDGIGPPRGAAANLHDVTD